ncbi:alpha/beta fold hydrolase [Oscillochloris sp. ZM17-4]|uniref:alpha/beta fold hydrolase n=1 Tax=Oscillochloris sp. ZM17-4 TaxID=2866714 RepID=UPI001C72E5CB|nr:alpha/beta fold hydrolase [Oscillochloris sp. ZM17-4]MBX0329381.1 alpha/beta fold hydrolase [Oscillochloris sp. ZM17-4]
MAIPAIQYIELPTGRLAYRRGGDGPPLLLIHGWGGSSRHWMGAFATLADSHSIYVLDMPGFGESPPASGLRGLPGLREAVLAFIDELGLGAVKLAGHSLGGAVSLMVAAAQPSRVEQLALVSFGLARSPEEEAHYRELGTQLSMMTAIWAPWLTLSRPWLALSRPWRQMIWTTPPLPEMLAAPLLHRMPDQASLAVGIADLAAMDALAAMEGASSQGDPQVRQAIPLAAMPALVLGGRQDRIFPPASTASLAEALPSARLTLIDECGHVPMAEQPEACYGQLRAFFTGLDRAVGG